MHNVTGKARSEQVGRTYQNTNRDSGYVTRFRVRRSFLNRYEVHQVGGRTIPEYWIPAEDLAEFNANIVETIEVVARYHHDAARHEQHSQERTGHRPGPGSQSAGRAQASLDTARSHRRKAHLARRHCSMAQPSSATGSRRSDPGARNVVIRGPG